MRNLFRSIAVLLALMTGIAPAIAQVPNFTLPPSTVIGRSAIGTGPAQAIPFASLIASMLAGTVIIPTVNTNSIVFKGSVSGQATLQAQAAAGTPTLNLPTGSGTLPSSATPPLILDPVTGILTCPTCATSTSAASPVVASRALARTLNLSSFAGLVTVGYAASGDGGGATFKNVGTAPFIDTGIVTGSISAPGSGCTNGTYFGVTMTGGTGSGFQASITVSGGVVTSVTKSATIGNGYTAGDVLSASSATIGCSNFTWTVATITAALGSFIDSVGTHFQITVDQGGYPNVRQFGAKLDRAGKASDSLATNDQASIQSALGFAHNNIAFTDNGGFAGSKVIVPQGTSLVCGGLVIPLSIRLVGVSESGTTLKECDTEASTQAFITVGDPNLHQTAFFSGIEDMTLFGANGGPVTGTVPMVYSNNVQGDIIRNVSIYPIYRSCVFTEIGWGGPSLLHIYNMYCVPNSAVTPFGISLNSASNQVVDGGTWFSSGGSPWGNQAILVNTNGPAAVNRFIDVHCENMAVCAQVNVPAGGNATMTYIQGMVGNATITDLIQRTTGSASGQLKVDLISSNGSNCTVRNAGTCAATGNVFAVTVY